MNFFTSKKAIWVIVLLCIVTRLPQLASDKLILDGDECVVALMAKHLMQGKTFPIFFYGQAYGFSLIECIAIVPFYLVFGITTVSVKSAMLWLWIIGIVFFYKTLLNINKGNNKTSFVLILLFICTPAWAAWSMKARGGYLTSFMLSSIFIYLLFYPAEKKNLWHYALAGLTLAFIYESQPVWMPGICILAAYQLWREKSLQKAAYFLTPAIIVLSIFYCYWISIPHDYQPPVGLPNKSDLVAYITRIPEFLYHSLNGKYFFHEIYPPDKAGFLFAIAFEILVFTLLLSAMYFLLKKRKNNELLIIVLLALIPTLLFSTLTPRMQGRYLLPVTGLTLLSLQPILNNIKNKNVFYIATMVLVVLGAVSLVSFKDFAFTQVRDVSFRATLRYGLDNGVHYAFSNDPFLSWETTFYSNEMIICRDMNSPGRYPPYAKAVNEAIDHGLKTALIGYQDDYWGLKLTNIHELNGYYFSFDVPKDTLKKNFQF